MTFSIELKVPGDTAFVSLVESFAADAAVRAGLGDEARRGLVGSVALGFTSIVRDALAEAREPIRVVATCSPEHLELSLFERGLPLDDAFACRDPRWLQLLDGVDDAHWHLHGVAGSELRLFVRRPHGLVAEAPPPATAEIPLAPPQEYVIRRFEAGDAAGVARAFYLTYGYAYDLNAVYVPSRLIELNALGRYVSIVAVAQDGEIVGHYALVRDDDGPIAEGGGAIVLPAHRGRDLLNRLRRQAEREAEALGLAAYFTEPVTDHGRTQRASESFGAKACGITLGELPRRFLAKHLELSTTTQRQSCMLYVKALREPERRTVYVPARHQEVVAAIYGELGIPVEMARGTASAERGALHVSVVKGDGIGIASVAKAGRSSAQLVRQAVDDLCGVRHLGAVYVWLPLQDPGTPELCESLEAYGFFFSGLGPWMLEGGDALRLQMPLTPIDLNALVVVGEFGKRLLSYIATERERTSSSARRPAAY